MANNDELIERADYYQKHPGGWALNGGNTAKLVDDLAAALREARADTRRLNVLQAELDVRRLVVTYEHRIGDRIPQGRLRTLADMLLEDFVVDAAMGGECQPND